MIQKTHFVFRKTSLFSISMTFAMYLEVDENTFTLTVGMAIHTHICGAF